MPIPLLTAALSKGSDSFQYVVPVLKLLVLVALVSALKYLLGGARNRSERVMHGKVVMMTGGTSGIGAVVARELAQRGAQLVLLTQQPPADPFVADCIDDLRTTTHNELVYAEQVDLGSLHSIRSFATRWIDNTPPRRLDMVVLCAATVQPRFVAPQVTHDGVEACWGVNCLSVAHLLSILSPALRAQPPDREVRIVVAACSSSFSPLDLKGLKDSTAPLPASTPFASSQTARVTLARHFQSQLDAHVRADKQPNNARVVLVNPGRSRTPGTRRRLTGGSLWGLVLYLVGWPLVWLVLKSAEQGAQSFLYASMEAELVRGPGGRSVRECQEVDDAEAREGAEKVGKELWGFVERQITALEKQGAVKRALAKKEAEEKEKRREKEGKEERVGKVLGEIIEEDGEATTATGKGGRKQGSRRSRKAG